MPVQFYPAANFVPVYSRPTRSVVDQVIEDDTPEVVRMTAPHYYSQPPPPPYYPYYLPAPAPPKSYVSDDLHYRMRPNLDSVVSRDYSQYGPLSWSWTDFTSHNRNSELSAINKHLGKLKQPSHYIRNSGVLWSGRLYSQA